MFKRAISLLFMVVMTAGLIASPAKAAEVTFPCGTSGSYTVSGGVVTGHTACVGNLNIDSSVLEIADNAFAGNSDLAAINIPGSVITIGSLAFNSASATSLTLGEGIIEIKSNAFSSLNTSGSSLDITIPDTVTTLGDAVFQQNTIGSLIIGDSIVNIPTQAFYSNAGTGPTSVEFGSSVKNIGNASFFGYRGRSLEIPEGIETIAGAAFTDANINVLLLPVTLTSIANDAFSFSPNTTVYCGSNPDISNYIFPEPNNAKVCGNLVYFDGNGSNRDDLGQQVSSNAVNLTTFNWRKTGSAFVRWTSNRDGTGVQYANGALFPFSARITTLYAQWQVRDTVDDSAITLGDSICDLTIAGAAEGVAEKPYLVGSALQLAEVNDCNDGEAYKYYRQIADIDLTPTSDGSQDGWNDTRVIEEEANRYSTGGWVPIGNSNGDSSLLAERSFSGSYDGNGKAVSGLTIDRDSPSFQGLFGETYSAEIKNLTIGSTTKSAAGVIQSSGDDVGVLVGQAFLTNFKNIHVKNVDIIGSGTSVGGVAGYVTISNATNVSFSGNLISTTGIFQQAGGIFGYMSRSNISNATVTADLTCDHNVDVESGFWNYGNRCGGIAGRSSSGSISQVKFIGNVTANDHVGGIVGHASDFFIDVAEFSGNLFATLNANDVPDPRPPKRAQKVGGIVGYFRAGTVSNVVNNGDIIIDISGEDGAAAVGGIVGDIESATLLNAVSNGNVAIDLRGSGGVYNVGGVVGEVDAGGVSNIQSNGNVTLNIFQFGSTGNVGGAIGRQYFSALSHSIASGDVAITKALPTNRLSTYVGGAVGNSDRSGILDVEVEGDVTVVDGQQIGGILGGGFRGSSVSKSSFAGDLNSISSSAGDQFAKVGGAVGYAFDGFRLSSTSVTKDASVTAPFFKQVGGLIGLTFEGVVITDSYNRAPVAGYDKVGGIIGLAGDKSVSVYNTYNTGTVTPGTGADEPDNDVFAAGGNFKEGLSLSNTFDLQTTGATTSATGVVGNATAAMKTKSTFEALGFDFSSSAPVWAIDASKNDGYPHLIEVRLSTQPVVAPETVVPAPVAVAPATSAAAPGAVVASVETYKLDKFSKNSASISKANKAKIASYAKKLKAGGYSKITIRSFTTSENTVLANKRAIAVTKLLKKYGVKVVIRNEGITRKSNSLNDHVRLIGKKN